MRYEERIETYERLGEHDHGHVTGRMSATRCEVACLLVQLGGIYTYTLDFWSELDWIGYWTGLDMGKNSRLCLRELPFSSKMSSYS